MLSPNQKYKTCEDILWSNIIRERVRGWYLPALNDNDLSRLGISDDGDKCAVFNK